ncbi:hypothetical protein ACNS7O_04165 [Haloferacaceae archaeon DSL9]
MEFERRNGYATRVIPTGVQTIPFGIPRLDGVLGGAPPVSVVED